MSDWHSPTDQATREPQAFVSGLGRSIHKFSELLDRVPTWLLVLLLLVIAVAKGGINFTPVGPAEIREELWPAPTGAIGGSSYGMRAITIYLELSGFREIALLGIVLTSIYLALVIVSLNLVLPRFPARVGLVLILGGPATLMVLSYLGRFDVLLLAGSWCFAIAQLTRFPKCVTGIGIVLMISGNPEQATIAGALLFLLALHPRLRCYRKPSFVLVALAGGAVAITSTWAANIGEPSRLTYWPQYLALSWGNFVTNLPLVLYSGYGLLWVCLAAYTLTMSRRAGFLSFLVLAALPTVIVATTIDQTRVFVGITTLAVTCVTLIVLRELSQQLASDSATWKMLVVVLIVVSLLLPSIEIDQFGGVREPYGWFMYAWSTGLNILG